MAKKKADQPDLVEEVAEKAEKPAESAATQSRAVLEHRARLAELDRIRGS